MAIADSRSTLGAQTTTHHKPSRKFPWRRILLHGTLIFFCLVVIVPLLWVFLLSIKSIPDAYTGTFWPKQFDFSHYAYVFNAIPTLVINMGNSIVVTLSTVVITCVCAVLAGYALVHLRIRGQAIILAVVVASLFFPSKLISLIAIFQIQTKLGLINTLPGLILPYVTLNLATSILIMRGMFQQISTEIVEATKIDGCTTWQTFWLVLLPLVKNGLVVLVIVNFVSAWGEYLLAITLTNDETVRTMPVVLAGAFGGMGAWAWPRIAAVYIMVITPGIIVFAIAQRSYMKGLLEGALKA